MPSADAASILSRALSYLSRVSFTATPSRAMTVMTIQSSMLGVFPGANIVYSGVKPEKLRGYLPKTVFPKNGPGDESQGGAAGEAG